MDICRNCNYNAEKAIVYIIESGVCASEPAPPPRPQIPQPKLYHTISQVKTKKHQRSFFFLSLSVRNPGTFENVFFISPNEEKIPQKGFFFRKPYFSGR